MSVDSESSLAVAWRLTSVAASVPRVSQIGAFTTSSWRPRWLTSQSGERFRAICQSV